MSYTSTIKFTDNLTLKSLTADLTNTDVNFGDGGDNKLTLDTLRLDGTATKQLTITNLDFDTADGIATYTTVTNSQNTSGTDIDATAESNIDGGSNSGWDFGVVIPTKRFIIQTQSYTLNLLKV